jgi:hypothetical protein
MIYANNRTLSFYGGNRDFEFVQDPFSTYPGLKFEIIKNLQQAKIVFEREYGNELYLALAKTIRIDTADIDFFNAIEYLEDYVTAKYNNKRTPYVFDKDTDLLIEVYYRHYYKLGLFRDPSLIRIFTHSYFVNLAKEFLLKSQADQESVYVGMTNEIIDTLGLTLHFGNQMTFLAIMHQIDGLEEYFPSFSDELTWTLYYSGGKYMVYGEYDGRKLQLESKADSNGDITLDAFIVYICSKVYFGDINAAAHGREDIHDHFESPSDCRTFLLEHYTYEEELFKRKLDPLDNEHDDQSTSVECGLLDRNFGAQDGHHDGSTVYHVTHPVVFEDNNRNEFRSDYGVPQNYRSSNRQGYLQGGYSNSNTYLMQNRGSNNQYSSNSQFSSNRRPGNY